MSEPGQADRESTLQGTAVKVLRWSFITVGGLLTALLLIIGVLVVLAIPIELSAARDRIENMVSTALERPFHIDGPLVLLPTLPPTLKVEEVRIGNPAGWPDSDLVRLRMARVQFAILPLLRDEVRIHEISVEGLDLQLESNIAGEPNWLVGPQKAPADAKAAKGQAGPGFVELRQLALSDVKITHQDAATGKTGELEFIKVTGAAQRDHPLQLSLHGTVQQLPYRAIIKGGSLVSLLDGRSAWPLQLSITAVGASFRINGNLEKPLHATGFLFNFDLQVPSTKEIEAKLGLNIPAVDSLALTGELSGREGRYRLDELSGTLGDTRVTGGFEVDMSGDRPQLLGALHIPSIDAGPFFQAVEDVEQGKRGEQSHARKWDLDADILTAEPLALFDAEISLALDKVIGASFSLEDASLGLKVANGRLTSPVAVIVAGVPFKGQITLGDAEGMPEVNASLTAAGTEIGELAKLLVDAEGIEGRFETARLNLSARGKTLRALALNSALSFSLSEASLSYGHDTGGQPVEFTLNRLEMDFPAGQNSRITAQGALLGEPVSLELEAGSFLEKFIYKQWPIELRATGSGARLSANGIVAPFGETRIAFDLAGERIGDLARWVGISQEAAAGYQLEGELFATAAALGARVEQGRLADTRFNGEVGIRRESGKAVTIITLEAGVVDLDRLMELFPEHEQAQKPQDAEKQYAIDVPILPKGIEIFDSDIELSVDRLKTGSVDVSRVKVSSQIRGGYVQRAPFQVAIADAFFRGGIGADLRGDLPKVDFDMKSMSLNIGELLEKLDLVSGLSLTTDQVEVSAVLEGASARDMMVGSEFSAVLRGGMWRIGHSNLKKNLDVAIGKVTITARRDQPAILSLNGNIGRTPLQIRLKTDSLASFAQPKERIRLDADIAAAKADIQLSGIAPLPVRIDDLHFKLALKGRQLSDFDELLNVSLPPWGPYNLRGEFGTLKTGYFVRGLYLDVGDSDFRGNLEFNGARAPPRLVIDLAADSIQLDDFDSGSWSVQGDERAAGTLPDRRETSAAAARALLSPAVMRSIDGALSVQVGEVLSGKDKLGSGRLGATLESGRLSVDPLTLGIPGGSVDLAFALEPTDTDLALSTRVKIERLDYGYLARRIDPDSTVSGLISVDADVSTRGSSPANVMHESNGHINFAVWPEGINAAVFDLWSTNLLIYVLPLLDPSNRSEVNCLVARFQLEDGIMLPSAFLADTTRVQASATGVIDFRSQTIDFRVVPRPKRPQMFSAETPLQIQGAFSDFAVGVSPGSLLGTTVRIITSPVVVPFQWVFTKRPPADGEAACQRVWGRAPVSDRSMKTETSTQQIVQ